MTHLPGRGEVNSEPSEQTKEGLGGDLDAKKRRIYIAAPAKQIAILEWKAEKAHIRDVEFSEKGCLHMPK